MIIGRIIRQLRNSKKIGLRELERLTGINRGNLSKIERGAGFGPVQLNRIAVQLGTTPAVLFALSEILQDHEVLLENSQQVSSLCSNLTNLFEVYKHSPLELQNQINHLLAQHALPPMAANG